MMTRRDVIADEPGPCVMAADPVAISDGNGTVIERRRNSPPIV